MRSFCPAVPPRCRAIFALSAVVTGLSLAPAASTNVPYPEREIEARGPEGTLHGTFQKVSNNDGPVVLIVPGSGPTDRDGNSPAGIKAASYRRLAAALMMRGIASVRIDKRGMFASADAIADPNAVTMGDYADDVHAWTRAIVAETGATCVWLLGHSEGGTVSLLAAANAQGEAARNICGVVTLAAPGRPLGTIMAEQLKANPATAPVLDDALAAIATLEDGRRVDTGGMHPALANLFAPAVQGFLIDSFAIDPAALVADVSKPVLIVQGEEDIQVTPHDARLLNAANPDATLALLPGVNHVLKEVPQGDRAANMASYADPSLPVAPGVVDAIAGFVLQER